MKFCTHNGWNTAYNVALGCIVLLALACVMEAPDEEDSRDRPADSYDVISDEDLETMQEGGLDIHEGADPPDIMGTWLVPGYEITFDEKYPDKVGDSTNGEELTFSNITDAGELEAKLESSATSLQGEGSFISGDDDCFTVYTFQTGYRQSGDSCYVEAIRIWSGCLSSPDVMAEGMQLGLMHTVTDPQETDGCDDTLEKDFPRILDSTGDTHRQ